MCEEAGCQPRASPRDHSCPAPPASFPFFQNKHLQTQTNHPAKAQMEPDLELISPVTRATRTGGRSSLSSPLPLPARPHPCSSSPAHHRPWLHPLPCSSWRSQEEEDGGVQELGLSPHLVTLVLVGAWARPRFVERRNGLMAGPAWGEAWRGQFEIGEKRNEVV